MTEPKYWRNTDPTRQDSMHYSIIGAGVDFGDGMRALRAMFPEAEADELNFVLFSTSGVHGHYGLIESAEARLAGNDDESSDVTFLVVHPRTVTLRYGNCTPETFEDIAFLKKLRASSWKATQEIGATLDAPTQGEQP